MKTDADAMPPDLLKTIEGKKRELDRHRPFPPAVVKKLEEQFRLEWTYNSNAIEGNTLNLRETELVLNRGLTIGKKSLREHFEVLNHAEAISMLEYFISRKKDLTEELVLALHRLILKNIDDAEAGQYRQSNVMIVGAVHIPPQAVKVPRLMGELIAWYHENSRKIPAPELAAWIHYKFVNIHPFTDGNGRTARLLMNLILMRAGYPPAVILTVDRKKYFRVLKDADKDRFEGFLAFIGRSIDRSLSIYLNAMKGTGEESERHGYMPLSEAAKHCDYGIEYLSYLARTGRLGAVKIGSKWMTTGEALSNYVEKAKGKTEL
ncbi:MAG: Fic family protein [Rectinemataceae bacterium]